MTTESPAPQLTQDQLLALLHGRGLQGDEAAYRQFLDVLVAMVQRYLRRRVSRQSLEVDDLVQEVVIAVHERRHTFSGTVPISAWIYAIARYKFIDWLRSNASHASVFQPLEQHDAPGADPITAWQNANDVRALLLVLPEKQRQAIECVKLQGLSVVEASAATGMSHAAVKINVHRGIKAMSRLWSGGRVGSTTA